MADTTYIWTAEGWLYLAVVLDLFSRMVLGWSMAATQDATLVVQALQMALARLPLWPLEHLSQKVAKLVLGIDGSRSGKSASRLISSALPVAGFFLSVF